MNQLFIMIFVMIYDQAQLFIMIYDNFDGNLDIFLSIDHDKSIRKVRIFFIEIIICQYL